MDISNNNAVAVKKKSFGRRKIPIELIRKKSSRQITFCKRRQGLFKKAAKLSVLCGAQITILVRSPADKIYAFGDPEAFIAHFHSAGADDGRDQESARSFRQTPDEEVDLEELNAYAEFLAGF